MKWTKEDIEMLEANKHLSFKELSNLFDQRSEGSLRAKCRILGINVLLPGNPTKDISICKCGKPKTRVSNRWRCRPCEIVYRHTRIDKHKIARIAHLKSKYKLSMDDYNDLLKSQDEKCAICNTQFNNQPNVDHDHRSGKTRGLLCTSCNLGIGNLKDDPKLCENAKEYLLKYRKE